MEIIDLDISTKVTALRDLIVEGELLEIYADIKFNLWSVPLWLLLEQVMSEAHFLSREWALFWLLRSIYGFL